MRKDSYTIQELKNVVDTPEKIDDVFKDLETLMIPEKFVTNYMKLFVSGIEEALKRKWPEGKPKDNYPKINIIPGFKQTEDGITLAGYLHTNNTIYFAVEPMLQSHFLQLLWFKNDGSYSARKEMYTFRSLQAGIEEGVHACQYNKDPEGFVKTNERSEFRQEHYEMEGIENTAKKDVKKILSEVEDDYEDMINEVVELSKSGRFADNK